jgi:hypothetical protein
MPRAQLAYKTWWYSSKIAMSYKQKPDTQLYNKQTKKQKKKNKKKKKKKDNIYIACREDKAQILSSLTKSMYV